MKSEKTKVMKSGSLSGAKGGSDRMLPKMHAGAQKSGVSSQEGYSTNGKPMKGGSGKMAGKTGAGVSKPGVSAGKSSSSGKFASGGKGKMAGKGSSKTAMPV